MEIKTPQSDDNDDDICCYCGSKLVASDLSFEPDYVVQFAPELICIECKAEFYESDRLKQ